MHDDVADSTETTLGQPPLGGEMRGMKDEIVVDLQRRTASRSCRHQRIAFLDAGRQRFLDEGGDARAQQLFRHWPVKRGAARAHARHRRSVRRSIRRRWRRRGPMPRPAAKRFARSSSTSTTAVISMPGRPRSAAAWASAMFPVPTSRPASRCRAPLRPVPGAGLLAREHLVKQGKLPGCRRIPAERSA